MICIARAAEAQRGTILSPPSFQAPDSGSWQQGAEGRQLILVGSQAEDPAQMDSIWPTLGNLRSGLPLSPSTALDPCSQIHQGLGSGPSRTRSLPSLMTGGGRSSGISTSKEALPGTLTEQDRPSLSPPVVDASRATATNHPSTLPSHQGITLSSYASLIDPDEGNYLEFILANEFNGVSCAVLEQEDVSTEIDYWNSSVLCFVLGSNPPF